MAQFSDISLEVVDIVISSYLDAYSLCRLGLTTKALHQTLVISQNWARHCELHFGVPCCTLGGKTTPNLIITHNKAVFQPMNTRKLNWRDVFCAANNDTIFLRAAHDPIDIFKILNTSPTILLSEAELEMRQEIILLQGLRKFPMSRTIVRLYAYHIRKHLLHV